MPTDLRTATVDRARAIARGLPPVTWVALALKVPFLVSYILTAPDLRGASLAECSCYLAVGLGVTIAWFHGLGLLLARLPRLLRVANLSSLLLLVVLSAYRGLQKVPLDFGLVGDNFRLLMYPQARALLLSRLSVGVLWALAGLVVALVALGLFTRLLERAPRSRRRVPALAASLAVVLSALGSPVYSYDDVTYLSRTALDYALGGLFVRDGGGFPYIREAAPGPTVAGPRPNVLIVMVESLNAGFVGGSDEAGRPYTPVLDAWRGRGLWIDRFYASSVQTCRGQAAVLASIIPSYRVKIAERIETLELRGLPAILRDAGYRTMFLQAFDDLGFDNTGLFMRKLGFDSVVAMDDRALDPADRAHVWGWGLSDDRFYAKALDRIDRERDGERPFFAVLATISSHMPFKDVPPELCPLYPGTQDLREQYVNAIHFADQSLGALLDDLDRRGWLRDTVVVITGDHSFPAGEHGNFFNEIGAFEESFRTPFLLVWEGHVPPREVAHTAYCQLDVAPTLLGLLGVRARSAFLGRSMLPGDDAPQRTIPLVQPYQGPLLASVLYPWKYVRSMPTGREWLYDLERDPREERSVLAEQEGSVALAALREEVERIERNQRLIETNRIWRQPD